MGLGEMRTPIDIVSVETTKDGAGFAVYTDNVIASVKAAVEDKQGSEKPLNDSVFSESSAVFRFRKISGVNVTPSLVIIRGADRFRIISVTEIKRMYIEALTEKIVPSKR